MEKLNVLDKLTKSCGKETICNFWEPYCDLFMLNYFNTLDKDCEDHPCYGLKGFCQSYRDKKKLEDVIMYQLAGHLTNQATCYATLNTYCTKWERDNHTTFDALCKDRNGNDTKVREALCTKLLVRVAAQCVLSITKLLEAEKEIQEMIDENHKLDKITKDLLSKIDMNLFLHRKKEPISGLLILSRQETAILNIMETEADAFDVIAKALDLYMKTKGKCQQLLRIECAFTAKCPYSICTCTNIREKCLELKPLEKIPFITDKIIDTATETSEITKNQSDYTIDKDCATVSSMEQGTANTVLSTIDIVVTNAIIRTTYITVTHAIIHTKNIKITNLVLHISTTTEVNTTTFTHISLSIETITLSSIETDLSTTDTTDTQKDEEKVIISSGGIKIKDRKRFMDHQQKKNQHVYLETN
ncbi:hypothetical protein PCK1_000889 [Pneumocystis canis]|nr:hypothetical protein PCK1_000889 [Pneumocystis canis]